MYENRSGTIEASFTSRIGLQVETMVEDSAKPRRFKITIKWAARVDVGAILEFIE